MWDRTAAALLGFLSLAGSAGAEDAPHTAAKAPASPPQISWAGFYVGVNGGGAVSTSTPALQVELPGMQSQALPFSTMRGAFGGVQAGYNWQGLLDAGLVLGVEGELEYIEATQATRRAPGVDAHTSLNSFGTLRGRVGYAWEQALLYATAGLAFGDIEHTVSYRDSFDQTFSANTAATTAGYTAGLGAGLSLTPAWSLNLEYQFLHLEGFSAWENTGNATNGALRTTDLGHDYQIIKAGLNYHVGSASQLLK